MSKKSKRKKILVSWIIPIVIIILFGIFIWYGSTQGWFNKVTYIYETISDNTPAPVIKDIAIPQTTQALTCQQIAEKANALYYIKNVSTAKECLDFAILDCQDTGKVIDGYAVSGTCCYYTCVAPIVPCIKTDDSSYAIFGTCSDSDTPYIEDYCLGGALQEQFCENNQCVEKQYWCPNGRVCDFGKCVSI